MVLYSEKSWPEREYAGSAWTENFIHESLDLTNEALARSDIEELEINLVHMGPVSGVMLILLI